METSLSTDESQCLATRGIIGCYQVGKLCQCRVWSKRKYLKKWKSSLSWSRRKLSCIFLQQLVFSILISSVTCRMVAVPPGPSCAGVPQVLNERVPVAFPGLTQIVLEWGVFTLIIHKLPFGWLSFESLLRNWSL